MIQQAIESLVLRRDLTRADVSAVFSEIADGTATPAQMAAFLVALRAKGETVEEVTGAAELVRERAVRISVADPRCIDTCGTGGDGRNTFNISTTAAFVVAAGGLPVAKHGNRSVSSRCGSADVLGALGVNVDASAECVEACIRDVGIGFLFAQRLHPAFKAAAAVRRELGVRTVFNLLGPIANPARVRRQVIGVYERAAVPLVGGVLASLGMEHAWVVHGDGLDELAVTGASLVCEVRDGRTRLFEVTPEEVGLRRSRIEDLVGGEVTTNAAVLRAVLAGEKGAPRDAVAMNAGAALVVGGAAADLTSGVRAAEALLDSGAAERKLAELVNASNAIAAEPRAAAGASR